MGRKSVDLGDRVSKGRAMNLYSGQRVGELTLVAKFKKLSAVGTYYECWECVCECGAACTRAASSLRAHRRTRHSCGCLTRIAGEDDRSASRRIKADPTPEEIDERNAVEQACWTPEERERRRVGGSRVEYELPTCRVGGGLDRTGEFS